MLQSRIGDLVKAGRLRVVWPRESGAVFGERTGLTNPEVVVRVRDALTALKVAVHPDRHLGEAYMDGGLLIERGTVYDLLALCAADPRGHKDRPSLEVLRRLAVALQQHNSARASRRNVAHHYDLSDSL